MWRSIWRTRMYANWGHPTILHYEAANNDRCKLLFNLLKTK